jgi:hypothetical protein
MASIQLRLLTDAELKAIHSATLQILRDTGIRIHHEQMADSYPWATVCVSGLRKSSKLMRLRHWMNRYHEKLIAL